MQRNWLQYWDSKSSFRSCRKGSNCSDLLHFNQSGDSLSTFLFLPTLKEICMMLLFRVWMLRLNDKQLERVSDSYSIYRTHPPDQKEKGLVLATTLRIVVFSLISILIWRYCSPDVSDQLVISRKWFPTSKILCLLCGNLWRDNWA